jgi:integrase/recombinase XerD
MRSYTRYNRALARQYDRWMEAMHYAKTTKHTYHKIISRYVKFLRNRSVANASHLDIRRFIGVISEEGATLNTAYQNLGVLRLFYDFLNLGGVVHYVAPRFVRLRRATQNKLQPLSESQVQRMLSACQTLRERAMIEFFYATGCRLSEARRIKIEDLDIEARTARLHGKFGKVRIAFLTWDAVNALREYIAERKHGYIFREDLPMQRGCLFAGDGKWMSRWAVYMGRGQKRVLKSHYIGMVHLLPYEVAKKKHDEFMAKRHLARRPRKEPLSKMAIQQAIRHIASRAGLKKVSPHTLRRTFATHLYDHGAGTEVIKALMGHVWIQTTMKYARLGPDRLAKTFERCHPRGKLSVQTSDVVESSADQSENHILKLWMKYSFSRGFFLRELLSLSVGSYRQLFT